MSHIRVDNSLTVDKRIYRYFDGHGNVKREVEQRINGTKKNVAYSEQGLSKFALGETNLSSTGNLVQTDAYGAVFSGKVFTAGNSNGVLLGAEASLATGQVNGAFSPVDGLGASANAKGNLFIAEAHGAFGASDPQQEFNGLYRDIGAKAAVVDGEISFNLNVLGIDFGFKVGGCVVCLEAELKMGAGINKKNNSFQANLGAGIGALFGVEGEVSISIPLGIDKQNNE